jgi:hypothetical protein
VQRFLSKSFSRDAESAERDLVATILSATFVGVSFCATFFSAEI